MRSAKRVAILGSTGSVGQAALDVISKLNGDFEVAGLSADSNIELLAKQAHIFKPSVVSIGDRSLLDEAKLLLPSGVKIRYGSEGPAQVLSESGADIVIMAISGMAALKPLANAVRHKKRIALANKEALVSAGPIIKEAARKSGAEIIPVDSEHSAIFQCIGASREFVSKIILTGSGGPLLGVAKEKFDSLSRADILKHPKWKMGPKITVDSATMMNKGLEIIEAQYLFDISERSIEVLIHPEAIVHSMVEFVDGSVIAQLASPDMRMPIQYALTYPGRKAGAVQAINFSRLEKLTFRKADTGKFPCLELGREAARAGATYPTVLCSADEEAVKYFLDARIKFSQIPKIVEKVMKKHKPAGASKLSLDDILDAASWAKEEVRSICSR